MFFQTGKIKHFIQDNFDFFDEYTWENEITLGGKTHILSKVVFVYQYNEDDI